MAIAIEASNSAENDGTNSTSVNITVPSGLSNSVALIFVSMNNEDNDTITGVTFGGLSVTLISTVTQSNDSITAVYYQLNPASGSRTATATFDGNLANGARVGVVILSGVDQTTVHRTPGTDTEPSSATTLTNTVASAADDYVFSCAAVDDGSINSVGAGQTVVWNVASAPNVSQDQAVSYKVATGTSTTMTNAISSSQGATQVTFAIIPAIVSLPDRNVSINDAAAVAENVKTAVDENPATNDQVAVDESANAAVDLNPNVYC